MVAPLDRDGPEQTEKGLREPIAKEVFARREVDKGKRRIENILRKIRRHTDKKRIVHRGVVCNKKHPLSASRNIFSPPHTGKIERKAEEQKAHKPRADHGNVRSPDPQTFDYSNNQHHLDAFQYTTVP